MSGPDYLGIECDGAAFRVSRYNAARLFALLAFMLGIQLSKKLGKAITL